MDGCYQYMPTIAIKDVSVNVIIIVIIITIVIIIVITIIIMYIITYLLFLLLLVHRVYIQNGVYVAADWLAGWGTPPAFTFALGGHQQ